MGKGSNPRTWNTPEFMDNHERIYGKRLPTYARKESKDAAVHGEVIASTGTAELPTHNRENDLPEAEAGVSKCKVTKPLGYPL